MIKLNLALAVIFAGTALTTRADLAQINFSGIVTGVSAPLLESPDLISVGDPFTGTIAWDTRWNGGPLPDYDPENPNDFIYPYMSLQIGGFSFGVHTKEEGVFGEVYIDNTAAYDSFGIQGEWEVGSSIFGGAVLTDSTGKAIITGGPSSNPADWNGGYIGISSPESEFAINGTIVFPHSVPDLSNTMTLLSLGIACLVLCRSRLVRSSE